MPRSKEKFIVNENGKRVSVILDSAEYQRMLDQIDELQSVRAYDEAKACKDEIIPFDQAIEEIEHSKK